MLLLQSMPKESRGLVLIFGRLSAWEDLPGWGVVLSDSAPQTTAELQILRKHGGANADTRLLLIGVGPGCDAVRRILLSNMSDRIVAIVLVDQQEGWSTALLNTWEAHAKTGKVLIESVNKPEALSGLLADMAPVLAGVEPSLPLTLPEVSVTEKGEG